MGTTESSRSIRTARGTSFVSNISAFAVAANCRAFAAIATAMIGALMFGIDQNNWGMVSVDPGFLQKWCVDQVFGSESECHDKIPPASFGNFLNAGLNLVPVASGIACLTIGPIVCGKCGRRACISTGGALCFLGSLSASFLNFDSVAVFLIAPFVTGLGCGIACFALPIYSSEVATPSTRGAMGSIFQWMCAFGGVLMAIIK